MNKSFKASKETINLIRNFYKDNQENNDNPYIVFFARKKDYQVSVYNTGTVLFSGENFTSDLENFYKEDNSEFKDHIGSDEVGCGDLFGPIVVCATLIKKDKVDEIIKLGIKDSKQLTDEKIKEIAPKLLKIIPSATITLSNELYNKMHETHNLNSIKAYLHNFVIAKLTKQYNHFGLTVIDQFCEANTYYKYLAEYKNIDIVGGIYFTTKAENKYLAVAAGSIIARFTFLKEMEKINKELNCIVPLGAGSNVDEFLASIIKEKGINKIKKYLKENFKNIKPYLNNT